MPSCSQINETTDWATNALVGLLKHLTKSNNPATSNSFLQKHKARSVYKNILSS